MREWRNADKEFAGRYARAREDQADAYAERMIREAEGAMGLPSEGVQAKRLLVDTLKWHASKLKPKVYGDSMTLAGDPERPLSPVIVVPPLDPPPS